MSTYGKVCLSDALLLRDTVYDLFLKVPTFTAATILSHYNGDWSILHQTALLKPLHRKWKSTTDLLYQCHL